MNFEVAGMSKKVLGKSMDIFLENMLLPLKMSLKVFGGIPDGITEVVSMVILRKLQIEFLKVSKTKSLEEILIKFLKNHNTNF